MDSNIDLFGVKVRADLITCLIQNGESFSCGERGLIQTRVLQSNGCLVGKRARQLDLSKAETNRFILVDEYQGAQICSANKRQDKKRSCFLSQETAQRHEIGFCIDSIGCEHTQRFP